MIQVTVPIFFYFDEISKIRPLEPKKTSFLPFFSENGLKIRVIDILIKYNFSETFTVVVMFTLQPPQHPSIFGFRDPQLQRLKGWICGPSRGNACPLGKYIICMYIV